MTVALVDRAWCVVVPHHALGARFARHRISATLTGLVPSAVLADTVTITAELVGNAVRHATPLPGGVIRVAWRLLFGGGLEIRVTDGGSPSRPAQRAADTESVDGRGLAIVGALAHRWGVERDGPGHCVWAELAPPS
jgi:anti-sigma regulatory factor (Ser/Thr protein kinase)